MLKNFINAFGRPVILVGLESIRGFIRSSNELYRRCNRFYPLRHFDLKHKREASAFLDIIRGVSSILPCEEDAKLNSHVMQYRIWLASQGSVGDTIELAKGACEEAMRRGASEVRLQDFSTAFRITGSAMEGISDPFSMSQEELSAASAQHWKR